MSTNIELSAYEHDLGQNKGVAITNHAVLTGFEDKIKLVKLHEFDMDMYKVLAYLNLLQLP